MVQLRYKSHNMHFNLFPVLNRANTSEKEWISKPFLLSHDSRNEKFREIAVLQSVTKIPERLEQSFKF